MIIAILATAAILTNCNATDGDSIRCGGLKTDQARRIKDLEKENARLRLLGSVKADALSDEGRLNLAVQKADLISTSDAVALRQGG